MQSNRQTIKQNQQAAIDDDEPTNERMWTKRSERKKKNPTWRGLELVHKSIRAGALTYIVLSCHSNG